MFRKVSVLVLLTVLLVLAGACAPAAPQQGAAQTDALEEASEKVLTVGHHVDPINLDPYSNTTAAFQSVTAATIEQLVQFPPGEPEILPGLAESWTWSDDGMTLELHLKEGVKFHNGEDFNAEAAKFSVELLMAAVPYERWVGEFESVDVIDENTIAIHFSEAAGFALAALARGGYVYPPEYYQEVGPEGFGGAPVGTGPYQFVEWVKDDHITFEKFPDYWGGEPALDQIVWRVIPEETSRLAALQTGEVDLITNVTPGSMQPIQSDEDLQLYSIPGLRRFLTYIDSRLDHPVADPKVRQAMNYAVDKQGLVALFDDQATAMDGQYLPSTILGYNPDLDPFTYDPEKAKELLAEAGYPDGFDMTIKYPIDRYPLDNEMGETVAAYLEAVGIRVKQIPLEYGEFRRQHVEEESMGPAWMWGLLTPPDPHMTLSIFGEGSLYTRYADDAHVFSLIEEGKRETDPAKREAIYQELMQIWNEQPLGIYMISPNDLYAAQQSVTGFVPRSDQVVDLSSVDIEQ